MAGGWDMIAFHDRRAAPVKEISVSSSGAIEEFLAKLAEQAGLGAKLPVFPARGVHLYENGEIHVVKERR